MSTLAFPLLHRDTAESQVSTQKMQDLRDTTKPAAVPGHKGELAFRRHVIAVYSGYMGATVLIASFYMGLVWIYFKLQ